MLFEEGLDLLRTEIDQMLEPSPSHGAMEFCRKRVKPPADLFDLFDREGLERTLPLDFSRDVDQPDHHTGGNFFACGLEKGGHRWFAGGYAQDPEALHRAQADVCGASQLCAPVRERVDRGADRLCVPLANLVERGSDVGPENAIA